MSSTGPLQLLAGRYRLDQRIASGGFGEVWQGTDVVLSRPVAVKLLRAEFAEDAEMLARFRDEAQHAGAVAHEGIARIYDYGEPSSSSPPFLVMEFVDGPSLADVLADGPLEPVRVLDVVAQAAAGLHAVHEAGLVHRDIKPQNVLIRGDGQVKLTDFGISHAAWSAPMTASGMLLGTAGYLAPERVSGDPGTGASDLYALGVVAYECLAGGPPFSGLPVEVALAHQTSPLPPLPATVPADTAALVSELTAKDPADRPSSAEDVARQAGELRDQLIADGAVHADAQPAALPAASAGWQEPGTSTRPQLVDDRKRHGYRVMLAVAVVVAAVIAFVLIGVTGQGPQHPPPVSARSTTVEVDGNALRGRPVAYVRRLLHRLGLKVRVEWRPTAQLPPGRVLSLSPTGLVASGTTEVVVGTVAPAGSGSGPRRAPGPGQGKHKGTGHPGGKTHRGQPPAASPTPTAIPTPTGSPTPTSSPTPTPTPSATTPAQALGRQPLPVPLRRSWM